MNTIEKKSQMIESFRLSPHLISFHGDPKIKSKYVCRVRAHQKVERSGYGS